MSAHPPTPGSRRRRRHRGPRRRAADRHRCRRHRRGGRLHTGAHRHPRRHRHELRAERAGRHPRPDPRPRQGGRGAEGVVVQAWPQIGVVVAHSTNGTFRADVAEAAGRALESVGSTRSVGVSEGTPADVSTTWGHGASGYKKDAKKPANGDVGTEATEAVAARPARVRAVGHADDQGRPGARDHRRQPQRRRRRPGQRDRPRPPGPRANIDVEDSVNCSDAGRPDTSPTGW